MIDLKVKEFLENRKGLDVILSLMARHDVEFIKKIVDAEIKKRDDQGKVKLLVVSDGFINHKFFKVDDEENAVEYLKKLKNKRIDESFSTQKKMINKNLSIDDRFYIKTDLFNADEVQSYLDY